MYSELPFQKLFLDEGNPRQRINQGQIVSALGSFFVCLLASFTLGGVVKKKKILYDDVWFYNAELGGGNGSGAQSFFGGATDGLPMCEW